MPLFFSLLSFLSPFILINFIPKTISQTSYMMAVYLIIIPASFLISLLLSKFGSAKGRSVNFLERSFSTQDKEPVSTKKFDARHFACQILILLIIFYSLYLFLMTLARYYNFRSEVIDLSYYDQVIHQISKFQIPKVWDTDWFVWGDHFDGILFLFAPLYWLKREPAFLMAIQSGLAILATIPIYLLAKKKLNNSLLALSISFSYLLFGSHQMGYLYGFHEIVMFPFFFFWMLFFMETKKTKLFLLFLFLTTIIKEETGFYLIFLGIYFLLRVILNERSESKDLLETAKSLHVPKIPPLATLGRDDKKRNIYLSFIFILTGLLWYLFTFHVIFPNFYPYWDIHRGLYAGLSSLEGIKNLFQAFKIGTIINHLAPFGFLPLLFPPSLIVTIPAWLQKLLTNDIASLSGFHYSSAITALIVFASIESISRLKNINFNSSESSLLIKIMIFIIVMAFYSNYFLGYTPSSLSNLSLKEFLPTPGQQTAYDFMKEIPKEASVSASYILTPHLKKPRGLIYSVPRNNEASDYILLNHNISIPLTTTSLYKQYLSSLENNYQIIKSQNNVFLLKRKTP